MSVGTYTVVATFPGMLDYTAAQSSPLTFIINQAMPTLTLSDARAGPSNGLTFAGTSLGERYQCGGCVDAGGRESLIHLL